MKHKLFVILSVLISCETKPQSVNPCIAFKLAFCKVKQDFAEEHGIKEQSAPAPARAPSFSPTIAPKRSQSSFNREPTDTQANLPARLRPALQVSSAGGTALKSTLLDRLRSQAPNRGSSDSNNDACAGLRFCVLKGNSNNRNNRRPTTKTTTEEPQFDVDKFLSSGAPSGANLINLVLIGDLEEARELIENGADVNSADQHGNSVLHIAAQNGRGAIVEDLILNGADVNKGNNHKNTALHLAAQNGWDEVAKHLLRAKRIKVNFKDLHANTAMHLAAQNGQIGVLEQLIEAGANINEANAHRLAPLHLAVQNKWLDITRLLVQSGADLDFKDLIGNTPLHTAYHNSQTEIARYLVASGANENSKNLAGLTPSQLGK